MQRISTKIAKWVMMIVAVLELAMSQIHIKAITVMFTLHIGFYLFLFILFGLLLLFLLISLKELGKSTMFKLFLTSFIASGSGAYCIFLMWKDYKANKTILFSDFRLSSILLSVSIAVYLIGTLVIFVNSILGHKEAKH